MKTITLAVLLATCQCCLAQSDTNLIAVGEWSVPASEAIGSMAGPALRGRLLVYGDPQKGGAGHARVCVELQRVSTKDVWSPPIGVYYDFTTRSSALHLELRDENGRGVSGQVVTHTGSDAQGCWVIIPSDATVGLRADIYAPAKSTNSAALEITVNDGAWAIPPDAPGDFYLSGSFAPARNHANAPNYYTWQGLMALPKVRIPAKKP